MTAECFTAFQILLFLLLAHVVQISSTNAWLFCAGQVTENGVWLRTNLQQEQELKLSSVCVWEIKEHFCSFWLLPRITVLSWNWVIYVQVGLSGRQISVTEDRGKTQSCNKGLLWERRAEIIMISCAVCSDKTELTPCGKCTLFQVGKGVTEEGICL